MPFTPTESPIFDRTVNETVSRRHSVIKVIVHTSYGDMDITGDILSGSVSKQLSNPAGKFSLTLRRKPMSTATSYLRFNFGTAQSFTWLDVIHTMSVVEIFEVPWKDKDDEGKMIDKDYYFNRKWLMTGFITSIGENRTLKGERGMPSSTITIEGMDMGGVFLAQQIYYNPYIGDDRAILGGLAYNLTFNGTPVKIMHDLVNTFLFKSNSAMRFNIQNGGKNISDWLELRTVTSNLDTSIVTDIGILNKQGQLWNVMQTYAAKPFNELFIETETTSGMAYLMFRPTPFSSELWDELTRDDSVVSAVPTGEINSYNVSKSTHEAVNLFWVMPVGYLGADQDFKAFIKPIIIDYKYLRNLGFTCPGKEYITDYAPVEEYGLKIMDIGYRYINVSHPQGIGPEMTPKNDPAKTIENKNIADSLYATCAKMNTSLVSWFSMNHNFLAGNIEVKGNAETKVGKYMRIIDREYSKPSYFYIEGYTHRWGWTSPFTTSVQVTRGVVANREEYIAKISNIKNQVIKDYPIGVSDYSKNITVMDKQTSATV